LKDYKIRFLNRLKYGYNLRYDEIVKLLKGAESRLKKKDILIPISIFGNDELSSFETICKYMKEELRYSYHIIAVLLNRDDRTIWATYNEALKKKEARLVVKKSKIVIPHFIFNDRRFSVLESLVVYLREKYGLRYSEIGILLNRDERNIWTVYNRARKKRDSNKRNET
jgi:hypothetical protein